MKTGDLLLFRGNRLLSGVIERLSDSPYSHVGIVARWHDRVVAFQADLRGVEVLPPAPWSASTAARSTGGRSSRTSATAHSKKMRSSTPRSRCSGSSTGTGRSSSSACESCSAGPSIRRMRTRRRTVCFAPSSSLAATATPRRLLDVNMTANDASTSPSDFATSGFFEKRYQLFDGSNGQACDGLLEGAGVRRKRRRALVWDGTKRLPPPPQMR